MRYLPMILFASFIFIMVMILVNIAARPSVHQSTEVAELPPLTFTALKGKTPWKQDALRGRVTLINFMASWCVPCGLEMPELAKLAKQYPGLHIEAVAWNDDPLRLEDWLKENKSPFSKVWLDSSGDSAIALGIRGIPESFIIDAQGKVRYRLEGPLTPGITRNTIGPLVTQLLSEVQHAP